MKSAVRRARVPCGRITLVAALVVCALAPTLSPGAARADDVASEADLQFMIGNERFHAGDYRGALEHYLASNRLVANRNVLFNIATSYELLHEFPNAFRYYTRALEGETDSRTRARIESALARLTPDVAILDVTTEPPGARIYIDRKDLGERGNAPQRLGLPPGRVRVIAEMAGYEDASADGVEVRVGTEVPVTLKLTRILGTVRVEGAAAGAAIRADSQDAPVLGTVPANVRVAPGRHILFLSGAGGQTGEIAVDVPARGTVVVRPNALGPSGTLVVSADEPDASIEVDGQRRGSTPAAMTLPAGVHRVRVSRPGFKTVERTVDIDGTGEARVDVQLSPAADVVAASRRTESVEDAPASVSIVSSQELRALQPPTVWEALRGMRGVYLTDDSSYPTVGFRGFSRPGDYGNRVLVTVDGQPMNDNWVWSSYTSFDLRTDLEDVERIEVVRGPGSALYGTGAFSGVINLVTRRDEPTSAEFGVSESGDGMSRVRARANVKLGEDSGVWTSVGAGHGQGRDFFFPQLVSSTAPNVGGWARGDDGLDAATVAGRIWWKSLTAQWSYNTQTKQLPGGQFQTLIGDPRTRQTDDRAMFEARFEPKVTSWLQSLTRAHFNYYTYDGLLATTPDLGGVAETTYQGMWAGLEQRVAMTAGKDLAVTAGGELQAHLMAKQRNSDQANGVTLDTSDTFRVSAGYLMADAAPLDNLRFSAGARLDAYDYDSAAGLPSEPQTAHPAFAYWSVNPRAAVIYKPYEGGNLKVLVSKGFRAPSVYELLWIAATGQTRNDGLQPENVYSAEIEYSHRITPAVVGLVSVYTNYITDLIAQRTTPTSTPTDPVYQYVNTDVPVGAIGAEAELRRDWKEGWMYSLSYGIQRSLYLRSASFSDYLAFAPNPALREVPNSPEHLLSARAAAPIMSRALTAMTRISYVSGRYDRNDAPNDPPQQMTNASVIWDLVLSGVEPKWGIRYAAGVYNIFDWRENDPVSAEFVQTTMPQAGRTLLFSVNATLQ